MTHDTSEPRLRRWLVRYVIPAIVASGTTVTTVVALGQVSPITPDDRLASGNVIDKIEFTSFGERAIAQTIEDACVRTDCDGTGLHPMIKAYADQMDEDQLDAARWAQVRLVLQGIRALDAAALGSDAAALAHLELTAAARIAKFYTSKIHTQR